MDATLFRSAFNPIIAEAHDASNGIYDSVTGETLIQGKSGLPIFVGAMSFAVKAVIEKANHDGDLHDVTLSDEHDAYAWMTVQEILERPRDKISHHLIELIRHFEQMKFILMV